MTTGVPTLTEEVLDWLDADLGQACDQAQQQYEEIC